MLSKVIAIDGPSASGKGTLASNIARELGWATLDSGSIYRAIGLLAGRLGLLDQESELVLKLRDFDLRFENGSCFLADEDLTQEIRTEEVGEMASAIASFPSLRETVLNLQRDFRRPPGLVADGRDMGTIVFPNADLKVFLDASAEARAERRYNELKNKGFDVNLPLLLEQMLQRDKKDSERSVAPLIPAEDSILIDSSGLSILEVTKSVLDLVKQKGWVEGF
jgi:cytidylate kinase